MKQERIGKIQTMRHTGKFQNALTSIEGLLKDLYKDVSYEGDEPVPIHLQQEIYSAIDEKGKIHQAMGDFDKARECFNEALEGRKEIAIDHSNIEALQDYGYSAFQIAIFESIAKTLPSEKIAELFELSAPIIQQTIKLSDNPSQIGDAYQNLAFIQQFCGNFDKAISFYHHALIYRENKRGKALVWTRIGECYAELGEYFAMEYFSMAKNIFIELEDPVRIKQIEDVIKKFGL